MKNKIFILLMVAAVFAVPLTGTAAADVQATNNADEPTVGDTIEFDGSNSSVQAEGVNVTVETSETVTVIYTETADGSLNARLAENSNNTTTVSVKITETDGDTFTYIFDGVGDSVNVDGSGLSALEFIDNGAGQTMFKADIDGGDEFTDVATYTGWSYKTTQAIDTGTTVNLVAYEWTTGDNTTLTGPTVSHSYDAAGDYSVNLVVTDAHGETHKVRQSVSVVSLSSQLVTASDFNKAAIEELATTGGGSFGTIVTVEHNGSTLQGVLVDKDAPQNGTYLVGQNYSNASLVLDDENKTVVNMDTYTLTSATDRLSGESLDSVQFRAYNDKSELVEQLNIMTANAGVITSDTLNTSATTVGGIVVIAGIVLLYMRD